MFYLILMVITNKTPIEKCKRIKAHYLQKVSKIQRKAGREKREIKYPQDIWKTT